MKILGIDFGTKKVGLAISDDAGEFAFPKAIVDRGSALEELKKIIVTENIAAIVIGESLASNEEQNKILEQSTLFAKQLGEVTGLPIHFQREDFSSVEAHRYQTGAGNRDDSAAAIILQRYLDKQVAGK